MFIGDEALQTEQNKIWGGLSTRYFQQSKGLTLKTDIEDDFAIEYPYSCNVISTACTTQIGLQRIPALSAWKALQFSQHALIGGFLLLGAQSTLSLLFEQRNPFVDFLILKIENVIVSYEQFPVSYNQIMIRGILRYCVKLLDRIFDQIDNLDLLGKIKRIVILSENLLKQSEESITSDTTSCGSPTFCENLLKQSEESITFSHLDLTYIENAFENIEEEAYKKGYLPKLEDMSL